MTDLNLMPPIGFVVEGHGEFNCYPSLVARIVGVNTLHVPIVNAGGCGGLVRNLEEHLSDLILSSHPSSVIVTVDYVDVIEQGLCDSCNSLINDLECRANFWLETQSSNRRMQPLPTSIKVVVQVQKFESWFVAGCDSLSKEGWVSTEECGKFNDSDVDIVNPTKWLREHLKINFNPKNKSQAKGIISKLCVEKMKNKSRSFRKFYSENVKAYENWVQLNHFSEQPGTDHG